MSDPTDDGGSVVEPLQITATMMSPIAEQLSPLNFDALLGAVVAEHKGLIAGVGEWEDVDVPVAWSPCGRYRMASVWHYEVKGSIRGYTQKRSPISEMKWFGEKKIKSVLISGGVNKACRIPLPRVLVDKVRWWCVGERESIEELLAYVTHLGKKRSAGHGRVASWSVEPCTPWEGFPVIRPDGTPMRNLPMDTPGLGPTTAVGYGPLTAPYWQQERWIEVAQPPDTAWMGVSP